MTATLTIPAAVPVFPLSIYQPVHVGKDEFGEQAHVELAERNLLIGGEPGGGKSSAINLITAHGALSGDCRLDFDRRQAGRARPVARLRRPVRRPVHG